ncbi:MAG: hypothetical protein IT450_18010 [Phycisphaerales bacterium]|nr:hypothetical protein [Phycisphaerales bacterium]
MPDLTEQIEETASNPASVATPDVTVTAQKVTDQIAADRYLRGEEAADTPKRGLRFTRMVPPGG